MRPQRQPRTIGQHREFALAVEAQRVGQRRRVAPLAIGQRFDRDAVADLAGHRVAVMRRQAVHRAVAAARQFLRRIANAVARHGRIDRAVAVDVGGAEGRGRIPDEDQVAGFGRIGRAAAQHFEAADQRGRVGPFAIDQHPARHLALQADGVVGVELEGRVDLGLQSDAALEADLGVPGLDHALGLQADLAADRELADRIGPDEGGERRLGRPAQVLGLEAEGPEDDRVLQPHRATGVVRDEVHRLAQAQRHRRGGRYGLQHLEDAVLDLELARRCGVDLRAREGPVLRVRIDEPVGGAAGRALEHRAADLGHAERQRALAGQRVGHCAGAVVQRAGDRALEARLEAEAGDLVRAEVLRRVAHRDLGRGLRLQLGRVERRLRRRWGAQPGNIAPDQRVRVELEHRVVLVRIVLHGEVAAQEGDHGIAGAIDLHRRRVAADRLLRDLQRARPDITAGGRSDAHGAEDLGLVAVALLPHRHQARLPGHQRCAGSHRQVAAAAFGDRPRIGPMPAAVAVGVVEQVAPGPEHVRHAGVVDQQLGIAVLAHHRRRVRRRQQVEIAGIDRRVSGDRHRRQAGVGGAVAVHVELPAAQCPEVAAWPHARQREAAVGAGGGAADDTVVVATLLQQLHCGTNHRAGVVRRQQAAADRARGHPVRVGGQLQREQLAHVANRITGRRQAHGHVVEHLHQVTHRATDRRLHARPEALPVREVDTGGAQRALDRRPVGDLLGAVALHRPCLDRQVAGLARGLVGHRQRIVRARAQQVDRAIQAGAEDEQCVGRQGLARQADRGAAARRDDQQRRHRVGVAVVAVVEVEAGVAVDLHRGRAADRDERVRALAGHHLHRGGQRRLHLGAGGVGAHRAQVVGAQGSAVEIEADIGATGVLQVQLDRGEHAAVSGHQLEPGAVVESRAVDAHRHLAAVAHGVLADTLDRERHQVGAQRIRSAGKRRSVDAHVIDPSHGGRDRQHRVGRELLAGADLVARTRGNAVVADPHVVGQVGAGAVEREAQCLVGADADLEEQRLARRPGADGRHANRQAGHVKRHRVDRGRQVVALVRFGQHVAHVAANDQHVVARVDARHGGVHGAGVAGVGPHRPVDVDAAEHHVASVVDIVRGQVQRVAPGTERGVGAGVVHRVGDVHRQTRMGIGRQRDRTGDQVGRRRQRDVKQRWVEAQVIAFGTGLGIEVACVGLDQHVERPAAPHRQLRDEAAVDIGVPGLVAPADVSQ